VHQFSDLDSFWHDLVPKTFPHHGDLLKRVPVPTFFANQGFSLGVSSARGDNRIAETVQESLGIVAHDQLTGVGIILDADDQISPVDRFRMLRDKLANLEVPVEFPAEPGRVHCDTPHSGVFVLPDNASSGTLETLLLECADQVYPNLLQGAERYVQAIDAASLLPDDIRELKKPAGKRKAMVGAIGSILKPGKSIQVSIQDNRWIEKNTLRLDRIKAIQDFLIALLDL
jgi:hypothetical protein